MEPKLTVNNQTMSCNVTSSLEEQKENNASTIIPSYTPGNLDKYREQIRMRMIQSAKHENQVLELKQMKKALDASTPRKKKNIDQSKQQNKRGLSQTATSKASTISRQVPDFQKKFEILHKREQERIQKIQQQNRRQTLARSPKIGPASKRCTVIGYKDVQECASEEFVADPRSLNAILGRNTSLRPTNTCDPRHSAIGFSSSKNQGMNSITMPDQNIRISSFGGNSCRVIPITQLYGGSGYDRRASFMNTLPPKTPDRHSFMSPRAKYPFTPKKFDDSATSDLLSVNGGTILEKPANPIRESASGTKTDMLITMLEQQMHDQPSHVQQQIQNLMRTLESGKSVQTKETVGQRSSHNRGSFLSSNVCKMRSSSSDYSQFITPLPSASTITHEPEMVNLPISRNSISNAQSNTSSVPQEEEEPFYVPSAVVKQLLFAKTDQNEDNDLVTEDM